MPGHGTPDADRRIMRTTALLEVFAVALLALGGAYAPRGATGWSDGYRSATRSLPGGRTEAASFGLVELTADDTPATTTLHVRLVVANTSARAPLALDARGVTLDLGSLHERPTFANSDRPTLPLAIVDHGETAVVDLYFALPPFRVDLSHFEITWKVATPDGVRTERTRFVTDELAPPTVVIAHRAGWGARWWFDPAHEWAGFYHHDGSLVPRPPTRVLVTRPPGRHVLARTS
jgi:hypothetical protein